jgi:hypothetical protein
MNESLTKQLHDLIWSHKMTFISQAEEEYKSLQENVKNSIKDFEKKQETSKKNLGNTNE